MTVLSEDHPLSAPAVARATGLTVKDIRALVLSGDLRYLVLPGRTRCKYTVADVREALERRKKRWAANAKTSSAKGRTHRSGTTTGPPKVIGFEAALRQLKEASPRR